MFCRFSNGLQLEQEIAEALENKDFPAAELLYNKAKEVIKDINEQHDR